MSASFYKQRWLRLQAVPRPWPTWLLHVHSQGKIVPAPAQIYHIVYLHPEFVQLDMSIPYTRELMPTEQLVNSKVLFSELSRNVPPTIVYIQSLHNLLPVSFRPNLGFLWSHVRLKCIPIVANTAAQQLHVPHPGVSCITLWLMKKATSHALILLVYPKCLEWHLQVFSHVAFQLCLVD